MEKAIVLLSGGQDSTTCLAWAVDRFGVGNVRCLTIAYGQRHQLEVEAAERIAEAFGVPIHEMLIHGMDGNALVDASIPIAADGGGADGKLPTTFVPGRNAVFLSLAAGLGAQYGSTDLVTGVCQADYSGYPDCRREFIDSLEQSLSLALDRSRLNIHTPLMWLRKAETVLLMQELGHLDKLGMTVTCYQGTHCGECPACILRRKGFDEAGVEDPLDVR